MRFTKFNWDNHKYLTDYDYIDYGHSAYESLKNHYSEYAYVITEVCLVDCSVTLFSRCMLCQAEVKKMIGCGKWNQEELEIVLADCERFLSERYDKAMKEGRKLGTLRGISPLEFPILGGNGLREPVYYKGDK